MRISDWSSDVCSSDLQVQRQAVEDAGAAERAVDVVVRKQLAHAEIPDLVDLTVDVFPGATGNLADAGHRLGRAIEQVGEFQTGYDGELAVVDHLARVGRATDDAEQIGIAHV